MTPRYSMILLISMLPMLFSHAQHFSKLLLLLKNDALTYSVFQPEKQ